MTIAPVTDGDLAELLPLMRAYCDFYAVEPSGAALEALARALLADPSQGVQLLARADDGTAVGFATLYWTWSTTRAGRIGIMNDLYVAPATRSSGVGRALIDACAERSRAAGAVHLEWRTAPDNATAQRLYDGVAPGPRDWRVYRLPLGE